VVSRASTGRRGGMTLIEVMLALFLLSLLSAFVFSIINSVLGLWQSGERRGDGDLAFVAAVERLRGDLEALHTGPRGWFILDDYEAVAADGANPSVRLPRLRFLAHGASLPSDDPIGRGAVEVAWLLVPTSPGERRVCKLLRMTRVEGGQAVYSNERAFLAAMRGEGGVPMLDGVLWTEFLVQTPEGEERDEYQVPADTPFHFPPRLSLAIERISADRLRKPMTLDEELSVGGTQIVVRGTPPLAAPSHVLVEDEWLAVQGNFPRLAIVKHAARRTAASDHPRGTAVYAPEIYRAEATLAANGRRILP